MPLLKEIYPIIEDMFGISLYRLKVIQRLRAYRLIKLCR